MSQTAVSKVIGQCYMCDAPSVSREHVPPRCLFPKSSDLELGLNLRKDLKTVPSCELHNSEKSGEDAYFLNVLTGSIDLNDVGREHYRNQIRRQNERNPSILARFGERFISFHGKAAHVVEIDRLDAFIGHLALGLFYAHFGHRWEGEVEWVPEFLRRTDSVLEHHRIAAVSLYNRKFADVEFHGANPDVFKYQVLQEGPDVLMRLHFYEGCKISLIFKAPQ